MFIEKHVLKHFIFNERKCFCAAVCGSGRRYKIRIAAFLQNVAGVRSSLDEVIIQIFLTMCAGRREGRREIGDDGGAAFAEAGHSACVARALHHALQSRLTAAGSGALTRGSNSLSHCRCIINYISASSRIVSDR